MSNVALTSNSAPQFYPSNAGIDALVDTKTYLENPEHPEHYDAYFSAIDFTTPPSPPLSQQEITEPSQIRRRRTFSQRRLPNDDREELFPPLTRTRIARIDITDEIEETLVEETPSPENKTNVHSQKAWRLIEKILEISIAKIWDEAVEEWNIVGSTHLNAGEDFETCLCGHYPIREIFHIENTVNHKTADIGNVCITLFDKLSGRTQIFKWIKEIETNINKKATKALINFAFQQSVLDGNEKAFYLYQRRGRKKRRLVRVGDAERIVRLNNRILLALSHSSKKVFQMLNENPRKTANPKLLTLALTRNVISERDHKYYLKIWKQTELDPFESSEKTLINQKILSSVELTNLFNRGEENPA